MVTAQIVALLVLVGSGAASSMEACGSCSGEGHVKVCMDCEGSGEGPCVHCAPVSGAGSGQRIAELRGLIGSDDDEEVLAAQAEVLGALEQLEAKLGEAGFLDPTGAGKVWCPAKCIAGRPGPGGAGMLGEPGECKPCGGVGELECLVCKGTGMSTCATCAGGEIAALCLECLGTGEARGLADSSVSSATTCPWCAGRRILECGACEEGEIAPGVCADCAGTGTDLCSVCAGGRKAPCGDCGSDGKLGTHYSPRGKCRHCKKRGYLRCKACKRGTETCRTCAGEGTARVPCDRCFGLGHGFCPGCDGERGVSWVIAGERLLAAGEADVGLAYLEFGVERERRRLERELGALEGPGRERKSAMRETRRRIDELEKKLERALQDR